MKNGDDNQNTPYAYEVMRNASAGDDYGDEVGTYVPLAQSNHTAEPSVYIWRIFFRFDTSNIPVDNPIQSVKLRLYGHADYSTVDFKIKIQKWTEAPNLDLSDYDGFDNVNYDDDGFNTTSWITTGYNNITISNSSIINRGGYTDLCIRSSRDVNMEYPQDDTIAEERIQFYLSEWDLTDKDPILEITVENVNVTFSASTTQAEVNENITISWTITRSNGSTVSNFQINITRNGQLWKTNHQTLNTTDVNEDLKIIYSTNGVKDLDTNITVFLVNSIEVSWKKKQTGIFGEPPITEEPSPLAIPIVSPPPFSSLGLIVILGGIAIFSLSAIWSKLTHRKRGKPRGVRTRKSPKKKVSRKPTRSKRSGRFIK